MACRNEAHSDIMCVTKRRLRCDRRLDSEQSTATNFPPTNVPVDECAHFAPVAAMDDLSHDLVTPSAGVKGHFSNGLPTVFDGDKRRPAHRSSNRTKWTIPGRSTGGFSKVVKNCSSRLIMPFFMAGIMVCCQFGTCFGEIHFTTGEEDGVTLSAMEHRPLVREMTALAGQESKIPCPGVTDAQKIYSMVWKCIDCAASSSSSSSSRNYGSLMTNYGVVGTPLSSALSSSSGSLSSSGLESLVVSYTEGGTLERQARGRVTIADGRFLAFRPIKFHDSGEYKCYINNRPNPQGIVHVLVQDVPDAPGRPLIKNFNSRMANLSWARPTSARNSPITHYIIYVRKGEVESSWDSAWKVESQTNDTHFKVDGLTPYTVYTFRVAAVNSVGPSEMSMQSFFLLTHREAPIGTPEITSLTGLSPTSLALRWRAPSAESIQGEFLGYKIGFWPVNETPAAAKHLNLRTHNTTSYKLVGLKPYTEYVITLQVYNPMGEGPPVEVRARTEEGSPGKPRSVVALRITNTSVLLSWLPPSMPNGILSKYQVNVQQDPEPPGQQPDVHYVYPDATTETVEYAVDGLEPFTNYIIKVYAWSTKRKGDASDTLRVTTDVAVPRAPWISNLTCIGPTTLYIRWTNPPKNFVQSYALFYRSAASQALDDWEVLDYKQPNSTEIPQRHASLHLEKLLPGRYYEIRVTAAAKSIYDPNKVLESPSSSIRKVYVSSTCREGGDEVGGVAGFTQKAMSKVLLMVIAAVALMVAGFSVCIVLCYKKNNCVGKNRRQSKSDQSNTAPNNSATANGKHSLANNGSNGTTNNGGPTEITPLNIKEDPNDMSLASMTNMPRQQLTSLMNGNAKPVNSNDGDKNDPSNNGFSMKIHSPGQQRRSPSFNIGDDHQTSLKMPGENNGPLLSNDDYLLSNPVAMNVSPVFGTVGYRPAPPPAMNNGPSSATMALGTYRRGPTPSGLLKDSFYLRDADYFLSAAQFSANPLVDNHLLYSSAMADAMSASSTLTKGVKTANGGWGGRGVVSSSSSLSTAAGAAVGVPSMTSPPLASTMITRDMWLPANNGGFVGAHV